MEKKDEKNLAPTVDVAPGPTPKPAAAPAVEVEGPGLEEKKADIKQEQKKQQPPEQDTGKNLANTTTWMEFAMELLKYLRERGAKKSQEPEQKDNSKLSKDNWNKVEASEKATEGKASTVTMGSHRTAAKAAAGKETAPNNEAFLKENLQDAGLTSGQIKGLASMVDKVGVDLKAVSDNKDSKDEKSSAAGNEGNKAFIQKASKDLGLELPKKVVDSVVGMLNKLGVDLNSVMNKAAGKGAEATKEVTGAKATDKTTAKGVETAKGVTGAKGAETTTTKGAEAANAVTGAKGSVTSKGVTGGPAQTSQWKAALKSSTGNQSAATGQPKAIGKTASSSAKENKGPDVSSLAGGGGGMGKK